MLKRPTVTVILVFAALSACCAQQEAAAAQCSVVYAKDSQLLFGDVFETCKSGCQPRNDDWCVLLRKSGSIITPAQ
jgi:hypothetical protein